MSTSESKLDVFDKMELFFKDPHAPNEVPGEVSTLYILRKDAWKCYGCDPETCTETTMVLFPGTMTVLCGIDLLAKFYLSDDPGKVRDRFTRYVNDFFPSAETEPDLGKHVYGLRNCLMHSFGMRDRKKASGEVTYGIKAEQREFSSGILVELEAGAWYVIDIFSLHEEFEESIASFKKHVQRNETLHETFSEMWDRYGSMYFSGIMLSTEEKDQGEHSRFLYPGYSMEWEL
jgi:hypothetical protein